MSNKVGMRIIEGKQKRANETKSRETAAEAERREAKQRDADWMSLSELQIVTVG